MIEFLMLGIVLGFTAGFSPGVLTALIVSETLKHNAAAGIKIALAPVVTDLPIVSICFFILYQLKDFDMVLGLITLSGACLVIFFGIKELRSKPSSVKETKNTASFKKGVLVNFLSPSPYIFWLSIGGPIVQRAYSNSLNEALMFIVPFYVLLIGSKSSIALIAQKSKLFLKGKSYKLILQILGVILILLGILLFKNGLDQTGII